MTRAVGSTECGPLPGTTPPRSTYEHVNEVSKPLQHKPLLETFRADRVNRDEELAANLALPLSDSDSEDPMSSSADEKESVFSNVSYREIATRMSPNRQR